MKYRLDQLFDLQMGKTPSRNNSSYWQQNDYKWVSIGDLSRSGKYISETKEYLSKKAVEESGIRLIPPQTVIMSFKLSIGKTAITAEPMYTNEAIMAFLDRHVVEIIPDFLYYLLSQRNWEEMANKAVMGKTLNKASLARISVEIPPVGVQRRIVGVLDRLQKLIDSHIFELAKLDDLVKSRFVELFGDLKRNTKGWSLYSFKELSEIITDGEHATPKRTTEGIYLLSARNVLNHSIQLDDVDYINQGEYDRISRRIVPQEGDILISCSGSVGRCCSVPPGLIFQMVRSIALVRFKKEISPTFAEYMITSDFVQEQIGALKTASSQANLFQGKIGKLQGFVPPRELQNNFATFVSQATKSKLAIQLSLERLAILRKSLMQHYFG